MAGGVNVSDIYPPSSQNQAIPTTQALGGTIADVFLTFVAGWTCYLADWFYDLHYLPLPSAQPYSFSIGNLWRVAIDYLGCPVPPCIHRAPLTLPSTATRLLLIS